MNQDQLIEVFSSNNAMQIEVLKSYLSAEGISVFADGEHQGGYPGVFPIRLMVPENLAEQAKMLIANPPGMPDQDVEEQEND